MLTSTGFILIFVGAVFLILLIFVFSVLVPLSNNEKVEIKPCKSNDSNNPSAKSAYDAYYNPSCSSLTTNIYHKRK